MEGGTQAPIAEFNAFMNIADDEWVPQTDSWTNGDYADASAPSNKFWKAKTAHAISTAFKLKIENTFPNIEPDVFFAMNTFDAKMKWDERIVEGKVVETCGDGSIIVHHYSPKPPIPIISQREMLYQYWTIKDH